MELMTRHMRIGSVLVGLLISASLASGAEAVEKIDPKLAAVEKKIAAAWKKHTSMTGKMTTTTKMQMGPTVVEGKSVGTYEMMKKTPADKIMLFRMDSTNTSTINMGEQTQKNVQNITMINDGKLIHTLMESEGRTMVTKANAERGSSPSPADIISAMRKDHTVSLLPDQTVEEQTCYVIQAVPKKKKQDPKMPTPPGQMSKMHMYVRQADGITVKTVAFDQAGTPTVTTVFSDIKLNQKIDPKRFVFKIPPGAQVMDMTKRTTTMPAPTP